MFRKLISNIAFSPALVGQLSFYAKRLKKEEMTRRLGLGFTVLALIVQSFAVFQPPEAANASSNADFVRGGVSSVSDFLTYYDSNSRNIKDLYNSLGITRAEIKAADKQTIGEKGYYNWSMTSLYSASQGQKPYKFSGNTVYSRPMTLTQEGGDSHPVYIGHSKKFGWFGIKKDCGNLITKKQLTSPPTYEEEAVGVILPTIPAPHPPATTFETNPSAVCTSLAITLTNRTNINLSGSATVNKATISSYKFTIKKSSGETISTQNIPSTSTSAQAEAVVIEAPGTYTASLQVNTSLGSVTDAQKCVKNFTIVPPAVCQYNPSLPPSSPDCQPCPGDSTIWIKDAKCDSEIIETKTATNVTQSNADASTVTSKASDRITYTVTVENKGLVTATAPFEEKLEDVLEYSTLVDAGGGTFNEATNTLTWPSIELKRGEKQSRTFVVQLASAIPATNTGTSNAASFNCIMTNTFGNSIDIEVDCPPQKVIVEQVVSELPTTGPKENMIFAGVILAIVTYFYARTRQTGKEIRLIRRDVNAGTI